MRYEKKIILKNGKELILRNGIESDAKELWEIFNKTHEETDFLLTYPDENTFDPKMEADFLKEKTASTNEIEIIAVLDGVMVGSAGIEACGKKYKVKHRAEFGISILQDYWGMGIGRALMTACIECAKEAGYVQLELKVVAENAKAVSMYSSAGFVEYGRNPKEFNSRLSGYQEVVLMRLEL